ncbi:MAG: YfiR family protein [Burkholderiales bacterium]
MPFASPGVRNLQPMHVLEGGVKSVKAFALLCAGLIALALAESARADTPSPAAVKAAFVYNFAKFVEWPTGAFFDAQAPLTLCLLRARESYDAVFTTIEGKPVQGRTLAVKHSVALKELKACQMVYLDEHDAGRTRDALRALSETPVLTVSDIGGFAESGGMIGLFAADDKIRFEVNVEAAHIGRLKISAQLLSLARIIRGPAVNRESK